jgi:hypothetical protein
VKKLIAIKRDANIESIAAQIGFAILAYKANQEDKKTKMLIYAALACLFEPFFKIALGRDLWNIVDVVAGIALIMTIFIKQKLTES